VTKTPRTAHVRSLRAKTGKTEKMKRLADLLLEHNISRRQLSITCGVSPATITRLINEAQWPKIKKTKAAVQDGIFKHLKAAGIKEREINQALEIQEEHKMASLYPQTLQHFDLRDNPFRPSAVKATADVLPTSEHMFTVDRIAGSAKHGEFIAIIGKHGAGKTTALNDALDRLRNEKACKICRVLDPHTVGLRVGSIIDSIGRTLGIPYNGHSRSRTLAHIENALHQPDALPVLVIIDDGHALHHSAFFELKRLWDNLVIGHNHLISIVILAQPSIYQVLDNPNFAEVRNHLEDYSIAGFLSPKEVKAYIMHRCRKLPGKWTRIFDEDVPFTIWDYEMKNTRGNDQRTLEPRQLNRICIELMNMAKDIESPRVTSDTVKDYYK